MSHSTELAIPSTDYVNDLELLSLDELAAFVQREHVAGEELLTDAFERWLSAGRALEVAHRRVTPGEWNQWVSENTTLTLVQARWCRRVAVYENLLRESGVTSTKGAKRLLKRSGAHLPSGRINESQAEEWRELRARGRTTREIAEVAGVHRATVEWHTRTEDEQRRMRKADVRKRLQRSRALRESEKQLAQKTRADIARRRRDATGESYSLLRKCLDVCQQALDREGDEVARHTLRIAMAHLHKAEDNLGAVLGTSEPRT